MLGLVKKLAVEHKSELAALKKSKAKIGSGYVAEPTNQAKKTTPSRKKRSLMSGSVLDDEDMKLKPIF